MKKESPWLAARVRAGKSRAAVEFYLHDNYPDDPEMQVARDRLHRFEVGRSAVIPVAALAAIAEFYDQSLRKIDPERARQFERHRTQVMQLPGCVPAA